MLYSQVYSQEYKSVKKTDSAKNERAPNVWWQSNDSNTKCSTLNILKLEGASFLEKDCL